MEAQGLTGALFKGMEWISRLAIVNLIWLLFSIPIITLLPATVALYDVTKRWGQNEKDIPIFRTFLHSFRENFWKSYKFGLPLIICGAILAVDIWFLLMQTGEWFLILRYMVYTLTFLFIIMVLYSFPVFTQFELPLYKVYFFAFILAISRPILTIIMLVSVAFVIVVNLRWTGLLFFLSFSTIAMISTTFAHRSWQKMLPDQEQTE